jgi:hypothetical protein
MSDKRGNAINVHPVFPSTVYYLDIPRMRTVTIQCKDNGIFFRWLHKTDNMFEPLRKSPLLDPSNFVTKCYWTWWSAVQEFSLHVALRKHQKRRYICNVSIYAGNNCHEWTPRCWRQRRDPSLTPKGETFAYFMLNDSEARFVIVK